MNQPKQDSRLRIGQIRRVIMKDGTAELVVVGRVNPISATCEAFLIDSNTDAASTRDFISLPEDEHEFAVSVMPDYSGNLESSLISESLVYGQLCSFCVSELFHYSQSPSDAIFTPPFSHDCFFNGENIHSLLSEEWSFRVSTYEKFSEVCNQFIDAEAFSAIKEYKNFYCNATTIKSVAKALPQGATLQDLEESMKTNPYARMLVRG